ncbi:hypothetical protein VNO77_42624 [Canavalia gladiata]|uniref:Uncharacterized protein n=1 Tax=Canavalia gladiata TaxID=3824 RepID=A0AAN9JT74_CANGL
MARAHKNQSIYQCIFVTCKNLLYWPAGFSIGVCFGDGCVWLGNNATFHFTLRWAHGSAQNLGDLTDNLFGLGYKKTLQNLLRTALFVHKMKTFTQKPHGLIHPFEIQSGELERMRLEEQTERGLAGHSDNITNLDPRVPRETVSKCHLDETVVNLQIKLH